jgi:hypothetical protein
MIRRRVRSAARSVNAGWTCRVKFMVFTPVSKNADNRISPGEQLSSHCASTIWRLMASQSTAPTCARGKPVGRRGSNRPSRRGSRSTRICAAARAGAASVSGPRRLRSMSDERAWRRGGLPASALTQVRRRFDAPDQGDPDLPPHREPASLPSNAGLRKERTTKSHRSHPRTFVSIARLKRAKSRTRRPRCTLARRDHTCAGRNGGFGPTILPSFDSDVSDQCSAMIEGWSRSWERSPRLRDHPD